MPARQSFLFLVISMLIAFPAGIANAEIDVENGNTRVRIDDYGIRVDRDNDDSFYQGRYSDRVRRSRTRVRAPQSRYRRIRNNLRYPRPTTTRSLNCSNRRSVNHQTITSRSGTASNRSYSSVTTTTCR
ncbi:MAG: hypothetical protein SAK29_25970 [Scytonema sp. PMC 1069.18]|nr:hypothetical protein [Scytonema sp. PMC 1069.18]MEC4882639.1 hypothetical protein [Scytonema sp. PMC 1070.18]